MAAGLDDAPGAKAPAVLRRLVATAIPLGPRMAFLRRERSLDAEPELAARLEVLDAPVRALVRRAQAEGVLRADLPEEWIVTSLKSLIFAAWALIAQGRIAPVDAPELVMRTLLGGIETPHSHRS
jgi:hypothetical protein